MLKCGQCGGKLRRVHRTVAERFRYLAIYACKECRHEECVSRRWRFHLGPQARCPRCGTFRVVKLKEPDRIDRMYTGFLNFAERVIGGSRLYHCRYCRVQFYDRRRMVTDASVPVENSFAVTTPQDTAKSDA